MSEPVRLKSIPLWSRWNEAALRAKFDENERAFDYGYRMRVWSDEEATFKSWQLTHSYGVSLGELQRNDWLKVTGVDLAGQKRKGNAVVTVAIEPSTRRRYLIDVRVGAWRSDELSQVLIDVDQQFQPRLIMVENNAYQQALIDWAKATKNISTYWMKLEPTTTGSNKIDPRLGLPSLQVEFKNQSWVVPASEFDGHTPDCPCSWCVLNKEFRFHPLHSSSDAVMATWFARQGIDFIMGVMDSSQDTLSGSTLAR